MLAPEQAGKVRGRRTHQTHTPHLITQLSSCPGKQRTHTHKTQRQRKRWREGAGRHNKVLWPQQRVCWHTSECTHSAASERKIRRCVYMVCGSQAQLPDAHRARAPCKDPHARESALPCPHSGAKIDWSAADRSMCMSEVQPCHEFFSSQWWLAKQMICIQILFLNSLRPKNQLFLVVYKHSLGLFFEKGGKRCDFIF